MNEVCRYFDNYFVNWLHAIPCYLQYLHLLQSVNTQPISLLIRTTCSSS